MSRRPDSAHASTLPAPDGSLAGQAAAERRSLPWWRLRTWRKDLDALTRLRDGLQAMDFDDAADEPEAGNGTVPAAALATTTAPAGTAPAGTAPAGTGTAPAAPAGGTATGASGGPGAAPADAVAEAGQSAASANAAGPDPAIVAIRDTFAHVANAGDEGVAYFYAWLFLRRPELRELFPPAMDEQRDRLFRALGRIVESLSTPDEMARYLSQLGRDHRKYGVTPDMYDAVGEALIATLRAFAQSAFTSEAAEAWTQTFAAAAALMIRAAEEDAAISPAYWTAEVVQVDRLPGDIAVVTVAPDRVLPYEAGQHLTLQTPRWPHVWRPYSIACRPREDGLISLHVKAIPGGWVSRALVHHTEAGDELILGPALGTMTLEPAGRRDLLCVAGGTGLAPIKAIVEQAVRDSAARPRRIYLFYGARKREQLYDLKDLWRLADAYHGLQLAPVTSDDPAFDGMQGNVGRVAARYMPHGDCEAYVAGPADMVRESIRVLTRAGIPRDRVHYDDALLAARARVGSGT
jgi:NAD(P)H-flavin reductase/hemoglobin-like flavoprotein